MISRGISQERQVHNEIDIVSDLNFSCRVNLFSETYCGGYSGEDPPLPIPNREVKLTIADGTAPPGGRVGSCHFLIRVPDIFRCRGLLLYMLSARCLRCPTQTIIDLPCFTIFCFPSISEAKVSRCLSFFSVFCSESCSLSTDSIR